MVLNRLRPVGPTLTEVLEEKVLDRVLAQLFPQDEEKEAQALASEPVVGEDPGVLVNEITSILKRKQGRNTAPGRDRIPLKAIGCLPEEGHHILAALFSRCLREGRFPREWKSLVGPDSERVARGQWKFQS